MWKKSLQPLVRGSEKLAQKKHKKRHDIVAKKVSRDICKEKELKDTERYRRCRFVAPGLCNYNSAEATI